MYYGPPRRKRIQPRIIIIIAAIAAGVIVLLSFLGILPSPSFGGPLHELNFALPDDVTASEHGILYNQNDILHLINKDGREQWNLKLELGNSKTVTSNDLILNYAGKTLQVMRYNKEPLFNTSLSTDIELAAAGKNSVAALTSSPDENGEVSTFIHIFNLSGEPIGQINTFANKEVIAIGFYGDADLFWVSSLDSKGVVPVSNITTFKPDGSTTNAITINNEITEKLFITESSIYASGTRHLTSYSHFSVKNTEQQIYGWRPEAWSVLPQTLRLAYVPRTQATEIDAARIYSSDLSFVPVRLPRNVFALAITQDKLYAFTQSSIFIYTMDGALERETSHDKTIVRAQQLSDNYMVLWDNQKSYIMELS